MWLPRVRKIIFLLNFALLPTLNGAVISAVRFASGRTCASHSTQRRIFHIFFVEWKSLFRGRRFLSCRENLGVYKRSLVTFSDVKIELLVVLYWLISQKERERRKGLNYFFSCAILFKLNSRFASVRAFTQLNLLRKESRLCRSCDLMFNFFWQS